MYQLIIIVISYANVLICSWSNILDGRQWNLNVIFADQSSQLGSVTFVNTISVPLVLFQKMSLVIVPEDVTGNYSTTKCRKINKISILSILKQNKFILGLLAGFWIYTVFPLPFLQLFGIKIDPTSFQPIFIATAVMTIPFLFMLVAWQKRSPNTSQSTTRQ